MRKHYSTLAELIQAYHDRELTRETAVIELDKIAGEALDILINGRLVARGEAVVVNDKFGIRISDIVSPSERIARLR